VFESGRGSGDGNYHLRVDGNTVRLVESPALRTDLWDVRQHLAAIRARHADGETARVDGDLVAVLGLWRGDPLLDLTRLYAFVPVAEGVKLELVDAALSLGERRLAEGDSTAALHSAERALASSPYSERALRLVLAVQRQRVDWEGVRRAVRRIEGVLTELGVEPEPSTAVLLRQSRALGPR